MRLNSLKTSLNALPPRLSAAQPIEANRVRGSAGVALCAFITGAQPDMEKVKATVMKGVRLS